jgi:hypothetical protein
MKSHFAPAERAGAEIFRHDRESITRDPIIGEILNAVGGLSSSISIPISIWLISTLGNRTS